MRVGGRGGGGRQAYKKAAYYRSQTSLDKGDNGVDFSLWLTKSDHVITLLCLCGFERKQPEEKFSTASYFLGQDFSWVTWVPVICNRVVSMPVTSSVYTTPIETVAETMSI